MFQTCKAVYDRIIDLKIANPQIIINYGLFLEEHKYFEEAFRVIIIDSSVSDSPPVLKSIVFNAF
jgi:Tfp pilus assembly protein PilF